LLITRPSNGEYLYFFREFVRDSRRTGMVVSWRQGMLEFNKLSTLSSSLKC
jgi:hypothetical protein